MPSGGFITPLPFFPFSWGGGTIVPVNPVPVFPVTPSTLASQLNIRGENNRIRAATSTTQSKAPSSTTQFVDALRKNLPHMFEAIQTNADFNAGLLRTLSGAFPFIGQDPSGNTVITGATYTVRAGNQTFKLANGRMLFGVANTPPADLDIPNGHVTAYLDEVANQLIFRVRYSDGTLKTGTVNLV